MMIEDFFITNDGNDYQMGDYDLLAWRDGWNEPYNYTLPNGKVVLRIRLVCHF